MTIMAMAIEFGLATVIGLAIGAGVGAFIVAVVHGIGDLLSFGGLSSVSEEWNWRSVGRSFRKVGGVLAVLGFIIGAIIQNVT